MYNDKYILTNGYSDVSYEFMVRRLFGGVLMRTGIQGIASKHQRISIIFGRLCFAGLLFLTAVIPAMGRAQTQQQANPTGSEPTPEPAIPAILAAFDRYEVVGMSEAHGKKDQDDFILSLIRDPAFPEKVNDIAVECGNSLYQPLLDRYIAGEDVAFAEAQKVWRNTTQPMCGMSGFFEQFFPLVRAINQKLPSGKRLRVLAGDPPIDWEKVKGVKDIELDRDASIASVMEKEVLSKHRKALMVFGIFHLFHGGGVGTGNAVAIYEKDYPDRTFIIGNLENFDLKSPADSRNRFAQWPFPSLVKAKGTTLGALDITHFYAPSIWADDDCNVHDEFPKNQQKPMADMVDAFLYLSPGDLGLTEEMPADIALDVPYMTELLRREALIGLPVPKTLREFDQQVVNGAASPILVVPKLSEIKAYFPFVRQSCLERKSHSSTPQ
jgi:hypothetical protein